MSEEANSNWKSKHEAIRNNLTTQNQQLIFYTPTNEMKRPQRLKQWDQYKKLEACKEGGF